MKTTGSSRLVKNAMRAIEVVEVAVASEGEGEVDTEEEEETYGEDELCEGIQVLHEELSEPR